MTVSQARPSIQEVLHKSAGCILLSQSMLYSLAVIETSLTQKELSSETGIRGH